MPINTWSDINAIGRAIQDDATFVIRDLGQMQNMVTVFRDASGMNPRIGYQYNIGAAKTIAEVDDLMSESLTPLADQTLTPSEIGLQFFVTDVRRDSEAPESIVTDAARELGFAALQRVETDLVGDLANMTGSTVGAAGTTITWGYLSAAIARARNANKSAVVPLKCVIHGYQWAVLAKTASVAGASSIAQAPGFTDEVTRMGRVAMFMGVPIYQTYVSPDTADDFVGGVFPMDALAIDWRRGVRIEAERDASRRGTEFNMSAVYAHGVWRPARGVKMIFDASAPTS